MTPDTLTSNPHRQAPVIDRAIEARHTSQLIDQQAYDVRESFRLHLADVGARLDLVRARRTIPRGRMSGDWRQAPAVDVDVWLTHVRYDRTRDPAALAKLVEEYEPYACSLAHRMHTKREPIEDLEQVAREALVVALTRFDPERGLPFPAFATPTILGALRRHFRDRGWMIKVPRKVHEITVARNACTERLTARLGRPPTIAELAEELGVSEDEVLDAEAAAHARTPGSLDAPPTEGGDPLGDLVVTIPTEGVSPENHLALRSALEHLDERGRTLIDLYYFQDLTQSQIAERFDVSQMQISRWLSATVSQLRAHM
ncbi:MAG: sigma-70 family RNA polymerase sigma factor [Aquihabitans sp.]